MIFQVGKADTSDALIIMLRETFRLSEYVAQIDRTYGTRLLKQAEREGFEAKPGQILSGSTARTEHENVIVVGLGAEDKVNIKNLRDSLSAAFAAARKLKAQEIAIIAPQLPDNPRAVTKTELGHLIAETAVLVGFVPRVAKSVKSNFKPATGFHTLTVVHENNADLASGLKTGEICALAVNSGRDMANLRSNEMGPDQFREAVLDVVAKSKGSLTATVLDKEQLQQIGAHGILAVNRGSSSPCYLIVVTYTPVAGPTRTHLGLVGKTVTYDTGGLSLKNNEGMLEMHRDKTGGVCVLSAIGAIAELGLPVSVSALFPVTENDTGPNSWRPGEITDTLSGQRFINSNSDAEGRVIQGDAITYAQSRLGVTHLVCASTLTGAARGVAANIAALLFSNDEEFERLVKTSSRIAGENLQAIEMFPEFEALLNHPYGDFQSTSAAGAGATIAASFLRKFVESRTRWAHLDIANVSWTESKDDPGATGFSIRTLIRVAQQLSQQLF